LLESNPAVFNRGQSGIWGAAIVWAVGSVNFLGDKSFEPYDVNRKKKYSDFGKMNCSKFGNKSAVFLGTTLQ
jgi:hypothetical protein